MACVVADQSDCYHRAGDGEHHGCERRDDRPRASSSWLGTGRGRRCDVQPACRSAGNRGRSYQRGRRNAHRSRVPPGPKSERLMVKPGRRSCQRRRTSTRARNGRKLIASTTRSVPTGRPGADYPSPGPTPSHPRCAHRGPNLDPASRAGRASRTGVHSRESRHRKRPSRHTRSPTSPAGVNRAPAKSTTGQSPRRSTGWAIPAPKVSCNGVRNDGRNRPSQGARRGSPLQRVGTAGHP